MQTRDSDLLLAFLGVGLVEGDLTALIASIGVARANHFAWSIMKHIPSISDEQISHLVRVFTLLENIESRFCGGSTSQVYKLLLELDQRHEGLSNPVREWAYATALNPYNPFGYHCPTSDRGDSLEDFVRQRAQRAARVQADAADVREAAERRVALRQAAHAARVTLHASKNRTRLELISELQERSPIDRLRWLIATDDVVLGSLPGFLVDDKVVSSLSRTEQQLLGSRLRRAPKGPWQRLRVVLESAIANQSGS